MPEAVMQQDVLHLSGDLTLATVGDLYRRSETLWSGEARPVAVDLSQAGRIDSAGLALLLEWQARARAGGAALSFAHPPADLLQLAALCEASPLLGLGGPANDEKG